MNHLVALSPLHLALLCVLCVRLSAQVPLQVCWPASPETNIHHYTVSLAATNSTNALAWSTQTNRLPVALYPGHIYIVSVQAVDGLGLESKATTLTTNFPYVQYVTNLIFTAGSPAGPWTLAAAIPTPATNPAAYYRDALARNYWTADPRFSAPHLPRTNTTVPLPPMP